MSTPYSICAPLGELCLADRKAALPLEAYFCCRSVDMLFQSGVATACQGFSIHGCEHLGRGGPNTVNTCLPCSPQSAPQHCGTNSRSSRSSFDVILLTFPMQHPGGVTGCNCIFESPGRFSGTGARVRDGRRRDSCRESFPTWRTKQPRAKRAGAGSVVEFRAHLQIAWASRSRRRIKRPNARTAEQTSNR